MTILVAIFAKSITVSVIILAITLLVRRQSAATQSILTHLGLGVLLVTPILVGLCHVAGIGFSLTAVQEPVRVVDISHIAESRYQPISHSFDDKALQAVPKVASPFMSTTTLTTLAFALWIVPAAILLLRLACAYQSARRLVSQGTEVADREVLAVLGALLERTGSKHAVRLVVSSAVDSPVSFGFHRAVIVLDPQTLQQGEGLQSILAHELAHIVARDSLRLSVARVATAIFWFNPLVWILDKRASFIREAAADEMVVASLRRPIEYASVLARHARTRVLSPFRVAHAIAPNKSEFKARIHRILNLHGMGQDSRSLRYSAVLLGLAAPLLVAAYGQVERKPMASPLLPQAAVSQVASTSHAEATSPSNGNNSEAALDEAAERSAEPVKEVKPLAPTSGSTKAASSAAAVARVRPEPHLTTSDKSSVSRLVSENVAATIGGRGLPDVGLAGGRDRHFAERAQEIFPRLADSSAIEMSILSRAASIGDLAAMRDYGLQNLGFHEIMPAASLGVRSGFLEVAVRNGCTQHTLDELMGIAAIGAVPGKVPASKKKCDVPAARQVDVRLRPFNG